MRRMTITRITALLIVSFVGVSASYAIDDWTKLYDQQFKLEQQMVNQQFRQMQQEVRIQQQYIEQQLALQSIWQNLRSAPIIRENKDWPGNFIGRVFNMNWFGRNVTGGQWYVYGRDERNQLPLGDTTVRGRNSFDEAARKHDIQYYIDTHFNRETWVQVPGPKGDEYFQSNGGVLLTNIRLFRDMLLGNFAHHSGLTSLPPGQYAVPLRGDSANSNNLLSEHPAKQWSSYQSWETVSFWNTATTIGSYGFGIMADTMRPGAGTLIVAGKAGIDMWNVWRVGTGRAEPDILSSIIPHVTQAWDSIKGPKNLPSQTFTTRFNNLYDDGALRSHTYGITTYRQDFSTTAPGRIGNYGFDPFTDKLNLQTTTRTYRYETFRGSEFNRSYGSQSLQAPQWKTNWNYNAGSQPNWNNFNSNLNNPFKWREPK